MVDLVGTSLGILEIVLATSVVAVTIVALTTRESRDQTLGDALVAPAAALSLGSAVIHLLVMPAHAAAFPPFGLAFLGVAAFQARWALAYRRYRSRAMLWSALAINAGVVAVWVWSRTSGLPVGPTPNVAEPPGAADIAATAFELGLCLIVALQLGLARDRLRARHVTSRVAAELRAVVLAAVCVVTFLAATAPTHGHGLGADEASEAASP